MIDSALSLTMNRSITYLSKAVYNDVTLIETLNMARSHGLIVGFTCGTFLSILLMVISL